MAGLADRITAKDTSNQPKPQDKDDDEYFIPAVKITEAALSRPKRHKSM